MATTIALARTKRRQGSIGLRQTWVLLLIVETPNGAFAMNTHSETANAVFQVLTIAVTALFSVLAVLHTAALIV